MSVDQKTNCTKVIDRTDEIDSTEVIDCNEEIDSVYAEYELKKYKPMLSRENIASILEEYYNILDNDSEAQSDPVYHFETLLKGSKFDAQTLASVFECQLEFLKSKGLVEIYND
jgi:hypothetical protein